MNTQFDSRKTEQERRRNLRIFGVLWITYMTTGLVADLVMKAPLTRSEILIKDLASGALVLLIYETYVLAIKPKLRNPPRA